MSTQVIGMRLYDNIVEMVAIFKHLGLKLSKISFFMAIFDVKIPITMYFAGLELLVPCLDILE